MGCASSKSKQKRCKHCSAPYSPVPRSYSLHVHHPPSMEGDSYHVVALSSTTIGSLRLTDTPFNGDHDHGLEEEDEAIERSKVGFEVGMIEAKAWSKMIDDKITKVVPKTPIRTPPGEPETINAWEMMEGLEDTSPLIRPVFDHNNHHVRSFSFHVFPNDMPDLMENSPPSTSPSPKPFWMDTPDRVSNAKKLSKTEFDPEIISAFRKALEELSPTNPFRLSKTQRKADNPSVEFNGTVGDVKVIGVMETEGKTGEKTEEKTGEKTEEGVKERLVLYFTSLRGVRKTYEECCNVRMILKSLGVRVDERDVSMHSGFKEELKELLGESFGGGLPRVFVGDNYIGGSEEIRRMHEEGKLEKVLERCEFVEGDGSFGGGSCEACGDVRFVPCETCSGSCKIYYEVDDEEEEQEEEEVDVEEDEFGFQRCPNCNENGLIRCPICCY
ncbi:hypothetical protein V2J09_012442 [Rumex salicifolius]